MSDTSHHPRRAPGAYGSVLAAAAAGLLLLIPQMAPGSTVAEQRLRLPPPAFCSDPLEGVWMSLNYLEPDGEWSEFTLEIHRTAGDHDALTGTMQNHSWYADPQHSEPPAICAGSTHFVVSENAVGRADGLSLEFVGVDWHMEELFCGYVYNYLLDRFSGTVDPELQEFQSLINDGGRYVNVPSVFRRVRCFDEDDGGGPIEGLVPPPYQPVAESEARGGGGCGAVGF